MAMLHVDIPTRADIDSLFHNRGSARVTLYLPTTPVTQHAQADRIAVKNLTDEALSQLADHDTREVRAIEELLFDLIDDDVFWEFQANSLAVFVTPESLRTFRLPNRLQPIVEVSDRFHVKPLLRAITVPQSAFVLALAQNSVRVIEVSADMPAFEVRVEGMPKDAASAVGKASIQDRSPSGRIQGSEGMKVRLAQYARKVDQALRDLLGGRETPLILAAAEPLRSIYRAIQSYPHLATTALTTNPEALSDAELAAAARGILDELFREEMAAIRLLFDQREPQGRTTTDVAQAARAATWGAVQTLLVDIDEVLPGALDDDGGVTFANGPSTTNYGIIDEIARRALVTGARVLGVRGADIPGGGSLAAILRYPF
jgi:Bacterial archaeo-eukaryotic release factor family 11